MLEISSSKKIIKIQKWWRKHTNMKSLRTIINYINDNLSKNDLQDLINKCTSITNKCKGDGAGLTGGTLIDMFLSEFLNVKLDKYKEYPNGESDMMIMKIPFSQKKITGRSSIALDWSKNKEILLKKNFNSHIFIINLKTEQWWKREQKYNKIINSGIYIVDKQFCKRNIELSSNNKTDRLIDQKNLYKMLSRSRQTNMFISFPEPNKNLKFSIINSFSE